MQADPRAFSRGKRGIAGSLIFTVFDRHVLHTLVNNSLYAAKFDDWRNPSETVRAIHETGGIASDENLGAQLRKAVYSDQIPPFDITLHAANEYGQMASLRVYGVEILNEGSGLSIDDIVNESQMKSSSVVQVTASKNLLYAGISLTGQSAGKSILPAAGVNSPQRLNGEYHE